jgi:hypothetical protein
MVSFPYLFLVPIAAVVNEAIHFTTGFAAMLGIFNSQVRLHLPTRPSLPTCRSV